MNIAKEVAKLEKMSVNQLRERFAEVCGETTIARNKTWLVRRIGDEILEPLPRTVPG